MITLRFVAHPGIFTWATQIAQYGYWATHVEVRMLDGRMLGAMFHGGVQAREPNYDGGNFLKEMFLPVEVTPDQEDAFYDFLRSQIGKPYDWTAIVSFYSKRSGRDWQARDSWFCSELIASALAVSGIFPKHMAVKFSRITVRDVVLLISTLSKAGQNVR